MSVPPSLAWTGLTTLTLALAVVTARGADGWLDWLVAAAGFGAALALGRVAWVAAMLEQRNPLCEACHHRASSHREPVLSVSGERGASRCYAPVRVDGDYESCGCLERFGASR